MKKITEEQVKTIVDTLYQINAPVQIFEAIRKMLLDLPECKNDKA